MYIRVYSQFMMLGQKKHQVVHFIVSNVFSENPALY